MHHTTHHTF
ncbi:unnamed protein product [Callosobruchus maculatus]|uniref:Uncharacterized protein n=1 Tax=Callosobruchus maculatus TaxID=64391 RepID=A0A653D415_CALMS|nr:unnamed protein product [Callosobruchus maculatus]